MHLKWCVGKSVPSLPSLISLTVVCVELIRDSAIWPQGVLAVRVAGQEGGRRTDSNTLKANIKEARRLNMK